MTIKPSFADDASPEAFAEAMMKCQGYAPSCSQSGECEHDGRCFSRDGIGFAGARKGIERLITENDANVFTRSWLKVALDALDHHKFTTSSALNAMKLVAINKRVRDEYHRSK